MASRVGLNARKNLDVVTVDEAHSAFMVELHEFLNVGGVNAAMIAAGLLSLAGSSETPLSESRPSLWEKGRCRRDGPSARG